MSGSQHQIIKNFANFGGLDLRSSDLIKDRVFATKLKNAQQRETTSLEKRAGYKTLAVQGGRFGTDKYTYTNVANGQSVSEQIAFDTVVRRRRSNSITITYSGAASLVLFSVLVDETSQSVRAQLFVTDTTVLDFDLGTGIGELSPVTLADLQTAVNAVPDFALTISGSASARAAFLPITEQSLITISAPLNLTWYDWQDINQASGVSFADILTNAANQDYENISSVNLNQCLYFGHAYCDLYKYDGQSVYRAGLPTSTTLPGTSLSATGYTDTSVRYYYYYIQVDNRGNRIESGFSPASSSVSPANQRVQITVNNIQGSTGFNTNAALVNGAQVSVNTITVTNTPHTLQIGDTAYFFDTISNSYVSRAITGRTATSITVAGAAVTVANADVISANLRIGLIRTTAAGVEAYEVLRSTAVQVAVELPNNPFAATQVFLDIDGARGFVVPTPVITPALPPRARYLAVHQNSLILAGTPTQANTVQYSDVDFIEGFDPLFRSFDCVSDSGAVIKGIGSNNEVLAVGLSDYTIGALFVVSGNLQTNQYNVDLKSKSVGIVSHQTIREVDGILYFLSEDGIMQMTAGQLPEEISQNIRPVFTQLIPLTGERYSYRRAIGVLDTANQKYHVFLPVESTFDGVFTSTTQSRVWTYDYYRNAWYEWDNLDFAAGAVIIDNEFWFQSRSTDAISGVAQTFSSRFLNLDTEQDYNDHAQPTMWEFGSIWESMGEPGTFKLFLRAKLMSIEPDIVGQFQVDFQSEINYIANGAVTTASVLLGNSDLGYGISAYGSSPYGDPSSASEPIIKLAGVKAKCLRMVLSNEEYAQNVILSGYQLEVALPYRGGKLKD